MINEKFEDYIQKTDKDKQKEMEKIEKGLSKTEERIFEFKINIGDHRVSIII